MKCAKCRSELGPGDVFCGNCGSPAAAAKPSIPEETVTCRKCGVTITADQRFCSSCGERFVAAPPSPPPSLPPQASNGPILAYRMGAAAMAAVLAGYALLVVTHAFGIGPTFLVVALALVGLVLLGYFIGTKRPM